MTWQVDFEAAARAELRALDRVVQARVLRSLARLATNPLRSPNARPIQGTDQYRLRVGDYRVVYRLHDDILTVLIVRVAHRREVYR